MRRFYWELCDWRRRGGTAALSCLGAPAMAPLLATLRGIAPEMGVRIACLVELGGEVDPFRRSGDVPLRFEAPL